MKQQQPTDALFEADAASVDRIAALCQVNWDKSRGFEQSYQKYQGKQVTSMPRVYRRDPMRTFITAACFMMAAGCAGGVYAYRQIAPSSNPVHEQWELPTQETDETDGTTETEPTSTGTTPVPMPVMIETQTTSQPSALPPTTVTVSATAAEPSDISAETTHTEATAPPVQETGESEPVQTQMPDTTDAPPEIPDETQTEPVPPQRGFVEEPGEPCNIIRFVSPEQVPLDTLVFSLDLEDYEMEELPAEGSYRRFVVKQSSGWRYTLDHFPYDAFQFSYVSERNTVEQVIINGRDGYLVTTPDKYVDGVTVLFWDDGTGITLSSVRVSRADALQNIAEHFINEEDLS